MARRSTARADVSITRIETRSGASAECRGEEIVLRDRKGAVIVVFDAASGRAEIHARSLALSGEEVTIDAKTRLTLGAPEVAVRAGKWELAAERVLERAADVYREVDGLLQTRAGRARTLVKGLYQLFGNRVSVRSEEDASIDGKRVLLG
jgi:hypothetical protein